MTRQFIILVLTSGLCGAPLGCSQSPAPPAAPISFSLPSDPAPRIELFDAVVTRLDTLTIRCEVKYRFLEGEPTATPWYCCMTEFKGSPGSYRRPMENNTMAREGTMSHEIRLARPGAEAFEIYLADAKEQHGPYRTVSNVLTGEVK